MYTYLPAYDEEGYTLPAALTDGSVAGIIVLNIYTEPLLRLLAALPLPKIFLDTVPGLPQAGLGGDLVLLEGRDALRRITGRVLDTGRRRLSFVGAVDYAQTNADRRQGFLDAHAARSTSISSSKTCIGVPPWGPRCVTTSQQAGGRRGPSARLPYLLYSTTAKMQDGKL